MPFTIMPKPLDDYPYQKISYFKGLNTLRFIAAFLVLMHHSESMKVKNGIQGFNTLSLFCNGNNAVTFFFVLSGFLITYILLKEKDKTQTVNVRKFYLKRVIRIWPLYFLLVMLGTVIIPFFINYLHIDYDIPYTLAEVWHYFVFFLPGLVVFYFGHHLLEPLWSIGVEEIFYLIWAPFFKFIKRNIFLLLLAVIIVMSVLRILPAFVPTSELYNHLIALFRFEAMAIGGLGAYFIFYKKTDVSSLTCYNKYIQAAIYAVLVIFLFFNINIENVIWRTLFGTPIVSGLFIDFMFLYLIIGVSLIGGNIIKIDNKAFSYFGEISYGIYMYHTTIISMVVLLLKKMPIELDSIHANLLFYILVTIGTILTSHLSKKYFENYFLRYRSKLN